MKHIVELLMDLALKRGHTKIDQLPGCLVMKIDETWTAKCNGHKEETESVPPYSWSIEYNGWPAGIIGLMGDGVICDGEYGNEENLRKAIEIQL